MWHYRVNIFKNRPHVPCFTCSIQSLALPLRVATTVCTALPSNNISTINCDGLKKTVTFLVLSLQVQHFLNTQYFHLHTAATPPSRGYPYHKKHAPYSFHFANGGVGIAYEKMGFPTSYKHAGSGLFEQWVLRARWNTAITDARWLA